MFDWLFNGIIELTPPGHPITHRMSPASGRHWRQAVEDLDTMVCGRRSSTTPRDGVVILRAAAGPSW
jgi:hypothetical protein